jgi:hypothetical protein
VWGEAKEVALEDFDLCGLCSSQLVTMAENFLTKSKDAVVAALAQATDSLALGADSAARESLLPFLDSFDGAARCLGAAALVCIHLYGG